MNKPADIDLIGYVLGALETDERKQVETALERDPQLRRQLFLLDEHLHEMRVERVEEPPPAGLADQTCDAVCSASQSVALPSGTTERAPTSRKWTMIDIVVVLCVCLAALTLFFPAIFSSRQDAQVLACQNKLRQLGTALRTYNDKYNDSFPGPRADGGLTVAGSYAPILFDDGYFDDPTLVICPSSGLADRLDEWHMPTLLELENARGERLIVLQQNMGGSFAFTLGYIANGHYYPTRNLNRAYFVIMADAPIRDADGWRSNNHGGRGHNVMFEDFRVEFFTDCCFRPGGDVFFENNDGIAAAGLNPNDAVVGSSAIPLLRNNIGLDR